MLILGDSIVLSGGDGWDAGFTAAASQHLGIAGTGVIADAYFSGAGEGFTNWGSFGWIQSASAVPANRQGHAWYGSVTTDSTPRSTWGWIVGGTTLRNDQPLDLHLWTASPETGGSFSAYRRYGSAPYARELALPAIATATPPTGLQRSVFSFPAAPDNAARNYFLQDATNTSILYSRMAAPGATGVTVTSWGYGGHPTLDFYNIWLNGTFSQEGRLAWLAAIVDGGSGKLNVVIGEGFNDRHETRPSLAGNPNGSSPEAFADNVRGFIGLIRNDWNALGRPANDLSFTLLGMYSTGDDQLIRLYAEQLAQLAAGDPGISFVDLYSISPLADQARELGYLVDSVHPSRAGALAYSELAFSAIVPEPATAALATLAASALLMRRRRCSSAP